MNLDAVNIGSKRGTDTWIWFTDISEEKLHTKGHNKFHTIEGLLKCRHTVLVIILMRGVCLYLFQHYLTGLENNVSNGAENECQKLYLKIPRSQVAIIKCLVRAYEEGVTAFIGQHWMSVWLAGLIKTLYITHLKGCAWK